jgi:hypothetical protein
MEGCRAGVEIINKKYMETKIKQIQTVFFTRDFNIFNDVYKADFFIELNRHSNSIFNGQPTMLPTPNDAPQEFPRFILNSADNRFSCSVALLRTDIIYIVPDASIEASEQLFETQKTNSQNIFNFLISKGIHVNRIGFVAVIDKILTSEDKSAFDYLRNNFIQSGKFSNPKELLFNYNRAGRLGNFETNNLITISAKENTKIILQTDVNTLAEKMSVNDFTPENFNEIIDYAIAETQAYANNFPNI